MRMCKIMNGWAAASGLVSLNLAVAFNVAASSWEARTSREGRHRLLKDLMSKAFAIGCR